MPNLRTLTSITLTKWYLDVLLDDGAVLLVYLAVVRAFGFQLARATVDLFPVDGPPVSDRSRTHDTNLRPNDIAAGARIDAVRVGGVCFDAREVVFSTPRLSGTLAYAPRAQPLTLLDPFLSDRARGLSWTVEVPDADVEGTLVVDGVQRSVRGRGYRDRVTTDLPPWRFPIRTLQWGRAVGGSHRASWVDATLADGAHRAASFVDDAIDLGVRVDGRAPPEVVLDKGRVLLSTRVASISTLALGTLRPFGSLVYGDPIEEKRAGRATVLGAPGFAIWETVRFSGAP